MWGNLILSTATLLVKRMLNIKSYDKIYHYYKIKKNISNQMYKISINNTTLQQMIPTKIYVGIFSSNALKGNKFKSVDKIQSKSGY